MTTTHSTALSVYRNIELEEIVKLIDWRVFLLTWDFRTDETRKSDDAKELLKDGRELLHRIIEEKLLSVDALVRILPAATIDCDDIAIYESVKRDKVLRQLPMLRRQIPMSGQCPSLADFIAPAHSENSEPGIDDYMGFFAVTAGKDVESVLALFPEHDVYSPLLVKSLADRLAEAGAEYIHQKVRREVWAYKKDEDLTVDEILKEKYQGIRPAPGYPCCPDHTGKIDIFEILDAEKVIGVQLTESYMMEPAASVCGYLFAAERAKYFPVGKIGLGQIECYAGRKGKSIGELKRWLSNNVND